MVWIEYPLGQVKGGLLFALVLSDWGQMSSESGHLINLSNPREHPVRQLVYQIEAKSNSPIPSHPAEVVCQRLAGQEFDPPDIATSSRNHLGRFTISRKKLDRGGSIIGCVPAVHSNRIYRTIPMPVIMPEYQLVRIFCQYPRAGTIIAYH
jgi:hypothetical protein